MNASVMRMNANAAATRSVACALPARRTAQRGVRATRKATVMSAKVSQVEKLQAAMLVSAAGALGSPLIPAAEAATVSPSLRNLLRSVVAGGTVLLVLGVALSTISKFDGPRGSSDRSHESTDLAACLGGRARGANPERACARGAGGLRNSF
eukprot:CAMPEP_0197502072 /NCGR_PEP_ID=MMETSP1312-20131121/1296_1 /TAXON_ID=464262 /ORGANISM="Genus nov. species nov., Strain RCC2335" /LENGTH=151 /DNA_ID=CAMNT_0043048233 /DNA_START=97 /DNA_END=553 /DNA_ORIENTATION=+